MGPVAARPPSVRVTRRWLWPAPTPGEAVPGSLRTQWPRRTSCGPGGCPAFHTEADRSLARSHDPTTSLSLRWAARGRTGPRGILGHSTEAAEADCGGGGVLTVARGLCHLDKPGALVVPGAAWAVDACRRAPVRVLECFGRGQSSGVRVHCLPGPGPAVPAAHGPELELPRLGQFPVPCAAIAGPRWPCPAAGHVAVAYFQVCDSAWGLRREECHIFQTIDMFGLAWLHLTVLSGHGTQGRWSNITLASGPPTVYQMYEEKVAGYLGPNKPKVCLKLPKPEQPEFLLSPVACPYPSLTMPSLVDCTCRTAGSDWGRVQVPHFCLFVSASGTLKACPQKHLNGILGCHLSKVPVSHAELWVRLQGYTCPQVPVDPQLASGSNEARRSDSSSTCSFAENIDSRNQLLLHKVPVTDGYLASNPKQDNTIEGSATSSHASQVTAHPVGSDVLRKEMIQRKCHFSKWRLSYRIPGFPLEVQRYQELLELQGPALATMKGCK
nr:uncharacterized protein LOC103346986 [Oryctolagus cuniculus]